MSVGPGDSARVSVYVAVAPEDAFDVFTREIDLWWKQGPQYRIAGRRRGKLFIEGAIGGRLFETFELPSGSKTIEVGRVTRWDPPGKLALEWRGVNFKPHEKTFVEVAFWSALPDDHPVRHGLVGAPFARMIGMWWGSLMTALREHVAERTS
jgi:hypothetical protein